MASRIEVKIDLSHLRGVRAKLNAAMRGAASAAPLEDMFRQWALIYMGFIRNRFATYSRGGGDWPALALSTILRRRGKAAGILRKTVAVETRAQREEFKRYYRRRLNKLIMDKRLDPKDKKDKRLIKARTLAKALAVQDVRRAGGRVITRGEAMKNVAYDPSAFAILQDRGLLPNALTLGQPGSYLERVPRGVEVGIGGPAAHEGSRATIGDIARIHQEGNPDKNLPQRQIIVEPDHDVRERFRAAANVTLARLLEST